MAADREAQEPVPAPPAALVHPELDAGTEAMQQSAERVFIRSVLFGALLGAIVGAGVWALIVFLALQASDWDLGAPMLMSIPVGMFTGAFYGGWAGSIIGNRTLEHAEHETLPHAS